ncbi:MULTISPECIES: hypothetical protein [Micromonospora]|uniref:hypothetical protein n=1 Tax=Micromonospora TaxID=1873 RepID=UPI00114D3B42|nr:MULTISPECIES: hypothetical protein [Micromonospora]
MRTVDRSSGGGSPSAGSGRRQENCHSFDPSTRVLLADGSGRPISALNTGDKVVGAPWSPRPTQPTVETVCRFRILLPDFAV